MGFIMVVLLLDQKNLFDLNVENNEKDNQVEEKYFVFQ